MKIREFVFRYATPWTVRYLATGWHFFAQMGEKRELSVSSASVPGLTRSTDDSGPQSESKDLGVAIIKTLLDAKAKGGPPSVRLCVCTCVLCVVCVCVD